MNHNRNDSKVYQYNTIYFQFYSRTRYYNKSKNNHLYIFRNLKQKVHHVASLGHIILIFSQIPVFALIAYCCVLSGEATHTNFTVFGLTRPGLKPRDHTGGLLVLILLIHIFLFSGGPSWSWSYGSWIYIYMYLCNQCISPLTLWVWTLLSTRYNIMW
jgi:hypothetical protein